MILIFLHIPKTGGNTLASVLYNQYHYKKEVHSLYLKDHLQDDIDLGQVKLIVGHHPFGIHTRIPKPCQYITMVREPVDRTISDYYFNLKFNNLTPEASPFSRFVKNRANRQTRWIAGNDRDDLDLAKTHIKKHFAFTGVVEMFNESLYMMKKQFGWQDITYTRYNVNENRPKSRAISKEQIDLIKQYNAKDIQLYNWIKNRLERTLAALDGQAKKEMERETGKLCKGHSNAYANPYDFV